METTSSNGNGKASVEDKPSLDPKLMNRYLEMICNAGEIRTQLARGLFNIGFDRRRNLNDECGYPETSEIKIEQLWDLFKRESVAARVVDYFPKECWKIDPLVYEKESNEAVTPFEKSWDEVGKSLRGIGWQKQDRGSMIWEYLQKLDILSGVGSYGIMLLGFNDGKDLSVPVRGVEEKNSQVAEPTTANEAYSLKVNAEQAKNNKLLYLRVFPQALAPVTQWETNPTSPRYNKPVMYSVTFSDPNQATLGGSVPWGTTRNVHWTRVIHAAETETDSSEEIGTSRMIPVLNPLLNIQKIHAADGEGYYRNAFAQMFLEMLPEFADVNPQLAGLRDMMEQMQNGLQRWGVLEGFSAKSIPPVVVDPTSHLDLNLALIAVRTGIPIRILKGSERGELSSGQDAERNEGIIRGRRIRYCTPKLIVPLVNRLIMVMVLQPPKEEYIAEWPEVETQTAIEKAQIAASKTQSLTSFISGGGEQGMTLLDFYVEVWGMDEERAQAIVDDAAEKMLEDEEEDMLKQQEMIEKGLAPDPTAPKQQGPIKMKDGERLVSPNGFPLDKGKGGSTKVENVFCPTGEGGGIDPTCGTGEGGSYGDSGGSSSSSGSSGSSSSSLGTTKIEVKANKDVDAKLKELGLESLGRDGAARVAGAVDGAKVTMQASKNRVYVEIEHPEYYATREILKDRIINNEIHVHNPGKGFGTEVFASQVEQAAKAGFSSIEASAARTSDKGIPGTDSFIKGLNGYYTWPRLGYDATLSTGERLSDLMKTEEGRNWWKENGRTIHLTFDLKEGSLSRRVLDEYRKAKKK